MLSFKFAVMSVVCVGCVVLQILKERAEDVRNLKYSGLNILESVLNIFKYVQNTFRFFSKYKRRGWKRKIGNIRD